MISLLVFSIAALLLSLGYFTLRVFLDMQPGKGSSRELREYQNEFVDLALLGRVKSGRLFRAQKPKGLIIISHNWGASQNRYYPLADELATNGYHVFLYDLRGQGKNTTKNILWIFGIAPRLREDLKSLIQELREREELKELPFYLMGYSLGAGISLEVFKKDSTLQGLICDSGPFSLMPSVCLLLVERTIPNRSKFSKTMINHLFCLIVNFPQPYRVIHDLESCRDRKIYLIECGRETFIPNDEIQALKNLWPGPVSFWHVDRAQHLMAYAVEPRAYLEKLLKFLHD